MCPPSEPAGQSGGINFGPGASVSGGEFVGRDKTINYYGETPADAEHRHREQMAEMRALREDIAREKGVDPKFLAPLFENLGQSGLTFDEMRNRAGEVIEATLARARQKVEPSNDGADIAATIGAARAKLGQLDTSSARSILAAKIAEEEAARRQRLIPLLEEQVAVEKLSYDHEAAKATLRQLVSLDLDNVWNWFVLGDLHVTTGALEAALAAFRQGDAIAERLAKADPGNAGWQRDLSVAHNKIGDVQRAQGDRPGALKFYHDDLAIMERLAKADPGNAEWQYDLGVSNERIGGVLTAQGDLAGAMSAYRAKLSIIDRLAKADPGNAQWQRDLSVSYNKVGDVLVSQGDLPGALKSYRDSLAIAERLAKADPGNAQWQIDVVVSNQRLASAGDDAVRRWTLIVVTLRGLSAANKLTVEQTQWLPDAEENLAKLKKR